MIDKDKIKLKYVLIVVIFTAAVIVLIICSGCVKNTVLGIVSFIDKDLNEKNFVSKLNTSQEFVGSAVWTMASILSGFVIMYYETMGYRNFGLVNRKIISYIFGSYFIPGLVVLNAAVVGFMTYMFYAGACTDFYILAIYSCALQGALIVLCVYSTTYQRAYKTIMDVEKKQFQQLYRKDEGCVGKGEDFETENEQSEPLYHIQKALESDETFAEKGALITDILVIPFHEEYTDRKKFLNALYQYEYENFRYIIMRMSEHSEERMQIYRMLYKNMENLLQELEGENKYLFYTYCGALFHALLPKKELMKDKWIFLIRFLNQAVTEEAVRAYLVVVLLMSIQFLSLTKEIDISPESDNRLLNAAAESFSKLKQCKKLQEIIDKIGDNSGEEYYIFENILSAWVRQISEERGKRLEIMQKIFESLCNSGREPFIYYLIMRAREGKTND